MCGVPVLISSSSCITDRSPGETSTLSAPRPTLPIASNATCSRIAAYCARQKVSCKDIFCFPRSSRGNHIWLLCQSGSGYLLVDDGGSRTMETTAAGRLVAAMAAGSSWRRSWNAGGGPDGGAGRQQRATHDTAHHRHSRMATGTAPTAAGSEVGPVQVLRSAAFPLRSLPLFVKSNVKLGILHARTARLQRR